VARPRTRDVSLRGAERLQPGTERSPLTISVADRHQRVPRPIFLAKVYGVRPQEPRPGFARATAINGGINLRSRAKSEESDSETP